MFAEVVGEHHCVILPMAKARGFLGSLMLHSPKLQTGVVWPVPWHLRMTYTLRSSLRKASVAVGYDTCSVSVPFLLRALRSQTP